MRKKAQSVIGVGVLMVTFITVIVALALFLPIAQTVGDSTNSVVAGVGAAQNITITVPANGITIDVTGQDLLSTPIVYNESELMGAGNYTIAEGVSATTGVKSIQYTAIGSESAGVEANISMTYGPDGYITGSGGRSMASLIPLMFAIAIAFIALEPTLRGKILEGLGK